MQSPVSSPKKQPASGDASISPRNISPFERDVVKIYKRKSKEGADSRYWLQYYFEKKIRRVWSDTQGNPLATEKTARKLASVIDYEIADRSHNPIKYQCNSSQNWIFKTQIQRWLEEKQKSLKPTTTATYEFFIRRYLNPFFGDFNLSEIKAYHGLKFLDQLPSSLSPKTKTHIINVLKMFFNYCSKADFINKPPSMPSIKIPERAIRWADYETQNKLLDFIPPHHKPIFLFSMRHGMRIGEVLGLMKKDLNFQLKQITIERSLARYGLSSTKTGKVRTIPIHPELLDALQNHCSQMLPDAFVFTYKGHPYSSNIFYKIAQKAAKKTGIKISAYELVRHSMITQAAVREVNPLGLQQYAGHSSLNTTKKYTNMNALSLVNIQTLAPVAILPLAIFPPNKKDGS